MHDQFYARRVCRFAEGAISRRAVASRGVGLPPQVAQALTGGGGEGGSARPANAQRGHLVG